jgi:hypothetical protein
MPEFLDVLNCFRDRSEQIEDGYSCPVRSRQSASTHGNEPRCIQLPNLAAKSSQEICYGYRYTEKKATETTHPWAIRQSGLYHQYDYATSISTLIVLGPLFESAFEKSVKTLLASPAGSEISPNPLLLHHMLLSTHLSDMRGYLEYFERQINPVVSFRRFLAIALLTPASGAGLP